MTNYDSVHACMFDVRVSQTSQLVWNYYHDNADLVWGVISVWQ